MSPERICATCGAVLLGSLRGGKRFCGPDCWPSRQSRYTASPGEVPETGDRAEILGLLMVAAKRGSVAAMKVLLDELTQEGSPEPKSIFEELAARRKEQS
jgi:hypothetical protein